MTNNTEDVNNKHRSIKDHTECGVSLGCDNATVLYTSNTRYGSTGDHIHHLYRGVLHYGQEGVEGLAFGDEAESCSHAEFRIKRRDTVEIDDHHSDLASVLLCGGVGVRRVYAEGASRAQPLHVCAAVHDEVCPDWAGDRQIG